MVTAMGRREAVVALLAERGDLLVVSGLGSPSYDLHAAGDSDANFYLWGAMGSAALVAFGLAQARPERAVLALTGDGEQLMGLGGLATIALAKPRNLTVAVIDNGHFGETGMQPSHTGRGLDLAAVAKACGFAEVHTAVSVAEVAALRPLLRAAAGPRFLLLRVAAHNPPRSLPPRDAVFLKNRFRARLGLPVS
ncbi:MAG: aldehyde dehydrogenase [Rhodospirillaceae bacterium]|nr:aldehyde dehydrogenase [Rhodospirillaceae bacterium]